MNRTSAIGGSFRLDRRDGLVELTSESLLRRGAGAELVEAEERRSDDRRRLGVTDGDRVPDLAQARFDRAFERAVPRAEQTASEQDFYRLVRELEALERDPGKGDDLVGEALDDLRSDLVSPGFREDGARQLDEPILRDPAVVDRLRQLGRRRKPEVPRNGLLERRFPAASVLAA